MRTISVNLYRFSELSAKAKQRALNDYRYYETHDWARWDSMYEMYEDAKMIGLHLKSFDDYSANGEFIANPEQVAKNIVMEHGADCETHKIAAEYLALPYEDRDAEELLEKLLRAYHNMLQKEQEYLESDEHLSEVLDDSAIFEFYADGSRYQEIKEG